MTCFHISISGNSGVGKSTLLSGLKSSVDNGSAYFFDESEIHHNFLEKLFVDPVSYSFLMQLNFSLQRSIHLKYYKEKFNTVVSERSQYDDIVFLETLKDFNCITLDKYDFCKNFYSQVDSILEAPNVMVFLFAPPEESYKRVLFRIEEGDGADGYAPIDYLYHLIEMWSQKYKELFETLQNSSLAKHTDLIRFDTCEHDLDFMLSTIIARYREFL